MMYRIEIEWHAAFDDGFWDWTVYHGDSDEALHSGTSYWRWTGLWKAGRWCEKHKKGKIRPVDTGARKLYYDV